MKIFFKEIKEGQVFFDGNHNLCVKTRPYVDTEDLFWADVNFNAIELGDNGHFYTRWFDDDYFITEDEILGTTEILNYLAY